MKLNIIPAKNDVLTNESQIGWLNMPSFGAGYLEFISRDLGGDDFEPAAALSDEANDALAELPVADGSDHEGWSSVALHVQEALRESFWSAMSAAIDLRTGISAAA